MNTTASTVPTEGMINLTHIIYALHAFSVAAGILGTATVLMMFLTGWPSLIAVILNYLKRGDARGTWLDSHFSWQIRTFWYALAWTALALVFIASFIGIVIGVPILIVATLWVIYRVVRGWLRLSKGQPMPV